MYQLNKKNFFFWCLILSSAVQRLEFSSASSVNCLSRLPEVLYEDLSEHIPWVDINPQGIFSQSCRLITRYYPCETPIKTLLPEAVQDISSSCHLKNLGVFQHEEGYCALENVTFSCHKP